jgi:serine/threonine-protein kinase
MLSRDEDNHPRVQLIDLGIAKSLDRTGGMTSTGIFLGKVKYASPEQFGALTAGERLDGRSDIYALGVVLYELLTGVHPFVGESPSELLRAHIFDPPLPFSQTDKNRRVPPELRAAIQMALEKRREDRFSSAEEFDRQIVALQKQYPGTDDLDDTANLISRVRAVPPARAEPSVTPSAQDRLDEQFAAAATPRPSRRTRVESVEEEMTEIVPFARSGKPSVSPGAPVPSRFRINRTIAGVLTALLGLAAGAVWLPRLFKRAEPAKTAVESAPVPTSALENVLPPAPPRRRLRPPSRRRRSQPFLRPSTQSHADPNPGPPDLAACAAGLRSRPERCRAPPRRTGGRPAGAAL